MRLIFALTALLAAALPLSAMAQAAEASAAYKLKQEEPPTGSSIKRDATISSFPYDKPYSQLSERDKQRLRALYEQMGPDDEPPFPLRGYKSIFKSLATVQSRLLVAGELDIAVIVDSEGNGTGVKVYKSPDPEMTKVVATLMMLERYKPALCKGAPCAQEFPLRMNFTLAH
jgi:hypothetical protein